MCRLKYIGGTFLETKPIPFRLSPSIVYKLYLHNFIQTRMVFSAHCVGDRGPVAVGSLMPYPGRHAARRRWQVNDNDSFFVSCMFLLTFEVNDFGAKTVTTWLEISMFLRPTISNASKVDESLLLVSMISQTDLTESVKCFVMHYTLYKCNSTKLGKLVYNLRFTIDYFTSTVSPLMLRLKNKHTVEFAFYRLKDRQGESCWTQWTQDYVVEQKKVSKKYSVRKSRVFSFT